MALSTYGSNHALAVRFWAKKLAAEALRKTFFADLIGRSTDSVIVRRDEMKEAGDRVTVGLRAQLTGAGVSGDGTLEGNEEALATYGDTLLIDQLRNGVRSAGRMSEQRVLFDFREEAKAGLSDWIADRWDTSYFNQICGFTTQNDLRYTGNNAVIAPDSSHIYRPNSRTTDESLTTGDEFNLGIIDLLVARAAQFTTAAGSGVPIRPASFNGQKKWIMGIVGRRFGIWRVVLEPEGGRRGVESDRQGRRPLTSAARQQPAVRPRTSPVRRKPIGDYSRSRRQDYARNHESETPHGRTDQRRRTGGDGGAVGRRATHGRRSGRSDRRQARVEHAHRQDDAGPPAQQGRARP